MDSEELLFISLEGTVQLRKKALQMYYVLVMFNIFLPFMPMSSNWPLSFRFPDRNFVGHLVSYATRCGFLTFSDSNAIISSRLWFRASSIIKLNKNQLDAHLF
jgi:hypothetical protein